MRKLKIAGLILGVGLVVLMLMNSALVMSTRSPDLRVNESGLVYLGGVDPELFGDLYPVDYDPPTMNSPPIVPPGCSSTELQTLAVASSSGGGVTSYGPQLANDGNTGYPENPNCYGPDCFHWISTNGANDVGKWFVLQWSTAQDICGMFMDTKYSESYEGGPRLDRTVGNAKIQYWNGSSWVQDGEISGYFDDWTYTFTSCINTTQIRLMDVSQNPSGGCTIDYNYCMNPMIYELCVFECTSGPTATPTPVPGTATPTNTPMPGTATPTPMPGTPTATPSMITVEIDIKPHNPINPVNLGSHGELKVAILSSATFDAMEADPETVLLAGASVATANGKPKMKGQYVNDDDLLDLVLHVYTDELLLTDTDTEATLTGMTYSMVPFQGTDMVRIVP